MKVQEVKAKQAGIIAHKAGLSTFKMSPSKAKITINRDQIQKPQKQVQEAPSASKPNNIGKPPLKNTSPIVKVSGKQLGKQSDPNAPSPFQLQADKSSSNIQNSTNNLTTTTKNITSLTLKTQHSSEKFQVSSSATSYLQKSSNRNNLTIQDTEGVNSMKISTPTAKPSVGLVIPPSKGPFSTPNK